MDELIKQVVEKAGISEDVAQTAINTVLSFLKDKLPAPIAGQLDGIINGDVDPNTLLQGGAGGFFKKLFGG